MAFIAILGLISRGGVLVSSIVSLSLNAKFLMNASWANDLIIYSIAIASFSVVACLLPPYPNFLYDLFWTVATALSAVFSLVVQFSESNCYGIRPESKVSCTTYKAGTGFTFLVALAWFASAILGGFRVLSVVFNIGGHNGQPYVPQQTASRLSFKDRLYGHPAKAEKESQANKVEQVEPVIVERRLKGFGNEHIARHFICYGILAIVLLAVGLPLLIIYAAPAFAVYIIDNAPLPDLNVTLLNPTNDSIQFSVMSDIKLPQAVSVRFDAINAEFFRLQTKDDPIPFATVDIPQLKFGSNERITIVNQTMKLGDTDQFAAMVEEVAYSPTFNVAGRVKSKLGIATLSRGIDLVKVVNMPGFDNFPDIWVNDISIKSRDSDDNNIFAEVVIFNPSPAIVTLGDVTLALNLANQTIGHATVAVDNIVPGNNTFNVRARLDGETLSDHITEIIKEQIPYLKEGNIKATATGDSVVYNGQHLEYWEKAFKKISISATRSVKEILDMVLGNGIDIGGDGGMGGILGGLDLGIGLDDVVDGLADQILDRVEGLDEDDADDYAESLGTVGKLALKLLTSLGVM